MGSPPSAAHTTPWPRPRPSRGLWPEARWSEGAAPPSRPCRTGTAAPEPKRSDDRPHAPWFPSATPGPSVYPEPQPSGIPAGPFSRSPYDAFTKSCGGSLLALSTTGRARIVQHLVDCAASYRGLRGRHVCRHRSGTQGFGYLGFGYLGFGYLAQGGAHGYPQIPRRG